MPDDAPRRTTDDPTRRAFLAGAATTGTLLLVGMGCSSDDDDESDAPAEPEGGDVSGGDGVIDDASLPDEATIFGWIGRWSPRASAGPAIRPTSGRWSGSSSGSARSGWRTSARADHVLRWEPAEWSLEVVAADGSAEAMDCFPVPFGRRPPPAASTSSWPRSTRSAAGGGGQGVAVRRGTAAPARELHGDAGQRPRGHDGRVPRRPRGHVGRPHVIPFGVRLRDVVEPFAGGGGRGVHRHAHGVPRATRTSTTCPTTPRSARCPACAVSGSDGDWLRTLAAGPVRVRLSVATDVRTVESPTSSASCPAPTTRSSSSGRTTTGRGRRRSRTAAASRSCSPRRRTGRRSPPSGDRTACCSCSRAGT